MSTGGKEEVDEMVDMFSQLLKGGLISTGDLVDEGYTDVASRIMCPPGEGSAVGKIGVKRGAEDAPPPRLPPAQRGHDAVPRPQLKVACQEVESRRSARVRKRDDQSA
eukprot:Hpha_TRINITY_DN8052_c0_g1::TRINITY_DN8052_c0_g1_i1::g.140175::m.140175